jgi:hypothetical protein
VKARVSSFSEKNDPEEIVCRSRGVFILRLRFYYLVNAGAPGWLIAYVIDPIV